MKQWHGTLAHYSKRHNAVAYRRIKDFSDYQEAENWLNDNSKHPIEIWHDAAFTLVNPLFAMASSRAYRDEHKKVID
jgi:hypothetical protein